MKKNRKNEAEDLNSDFWIGSYAHFVTLLFALFVVLFAVSDANRKKLEKAALSLKEAFATEQKLNQTSSPQQHSKHDPSQLKSNEIQFTTLKNDLTQVLQIQFGESPENSKGNLEETEQGLLLKLAIEDLFEYDSARVELPYHSLLKGIGEVLKRSTRFIQIEGHADPLERKTQNFQSTWELSLARAAWVTRFLEDRLGMDPRRFTVVGHGHHRPLKEEQGIQTESKNRRVEIHILKKVFKK